MAEAIQPPLIHLSKTKWPVIEVTVEPFIALRGRATGVFLSEGVPATCVYACCKQMSIKLNSLAPHCSMCKQGNIEYWHEWVCNCIACR